MSVTACCRRSWISCGGLRPVACERQPDGEQALDHGVVEVTGDPLALSQQLELLDVAPGAGERERRPTPGCRTPAAGRCRAVRAGRCRATARSRAPRRPRRPRGAEGTVPSPGRRPRAARGTRRSARRSETISGRSARATAVTIESSSALAPRERAGAVTQGAHHVEAFAARLRRPGGDQRRADHRPDAADDQPEQFHLGPVLERGLVELADRLERARARDGARCGRASLWRTRGACRRSRASPRSSSPPRSDGRWHACANPPPGLGPRPRRVRGSRSGCPDAISSTT